MPKKIDPAALKQVRPLVKSIVKKDVGQLTRYVAGLNSILKDPNVVALRICECCINIVISRPGDKVSDVNILVK
jgi:hypothetical protein